MRLIDADVLKQHIDKLPALPDGNFAGNHSALKALINMQPTIQPVATDTNVGDTISRQAAVDAVEKNACNTQRIMEAVNNLPPAQPEPKEGHWINGKCDLCGEHAPFWCMASTYHESNYCPRCGARMKGERQK